jgi:hypothetical protein
MVSTMKVEDEDTHSLDAWTPLGKAASDLLTKLRDQTQSNSPSRDQTRLEISPTREGQRAYATKG